MAERPSNLESVVYAIELLRRIPRGQTITAEILHGQLLHAGLKRELRTVQRHLDTLSEHFKIDCDDRSKPYQYRWLERAEGISLPNLTLQESLLLRLAEEQLKNMLPARLMKSMDGFFKQARRNLFDAGDTHLEREWPRKVRVVATSQPLLPPKIDPAVFEAVSDALYHNRWLNLHYRNAKGEASTPKVMPLGLAQQGPRQYLVCRFDGYEDERNLAMHRIESAKVSTLTFKRPKEFDLEKYEADGRFRLGDGTKIQLTFCIDRKVGAPLLESRLSDDQQHVELTDAYEISATVVDSPMLRRWLRGYGKAVWNVRGCLLDD